MAEDEPRGADDATSAQPEAERSAEQRRAALRSLMQSQAQAPAESPTPGTAASQRGAGGANASGRHAERPVERPRGLRAGGFALVGLVIIALITVVAANVARAPRGAPSGHASIVHTAPKPVVRLNPLGDSLLCASQVVWSPDGKQIAALGNMLDCGPSSEGQQTTGLFLYDAQTGKLSQQLQPDTTLFGDQALQDAVTKSESNAYNTPELTFTNLVWTPDGQALLMPFSVETSGPKDTVATYVTGLMRLGLRHSGLTKVWLDPLHSIGSGMVERWDLATGVPVALPAPPSTTAYRWNSDGSLAADASVASATVGSPIKGQGFTIWQPGYLAYPAGPSGSATPTPPNTREIDWNAPVAALSPNGRYFYMQFPASGRLVPPSTALAQPSMPTLAPRDPALQALAQQMTPASAPNPGAAILVAWRPDGKLLAAVNLNPVNLNPAGPQNATSSVFTVSLYDTTTGSQIKQLTPDLTGLNSPDAALETLMWSPDGQRLLLQENARGSITIWGPGALPQG